MLKECCCLTVFCIKLMYSKTKWMHRSKQHPSDPTHTFRVDCLGSLPALCKVNNQQGRSRSQQCTNPLLIISRILHNTATKIVGKAEMPALALGYPVTSSSEGFWKI